jgi:hypothetical protein
MFEDDWESNESVTKIMRDLYASAPLEEATATASDPFWAGLNEYEKSMTRWSMRTIVTVGGGETRATKHALLRGLVASCFANAASAARVSDFRGAVMPALTAAGGFAAFNVYLDAADSNVVDNAVVLITALTRDSPETAAALLAGGGVERLIHMIDAHAPRSGFRENAMRALFAVSCDSGCRRRILAAGGVTSMLGLLESGSFAESAHAATALVMFAVDSATVGGLVGLGAIPKIVTALAASTGAPALKAMLFNLLNSLALGGYRRAVGRSGALAEVCASLNSTNEDVQSTALTLIGTMASEREFPIDAGGMARITGLASSPNEEVATAAVAAAAALALPVV